MTKDSFSYSVSKYSIAKLLQLLSVKSKASLPHIKNKNHSRYFREYFAKIGAKTILIENDYFDRAFLEDFAGYYVRCFNPYKRLCARFHFFDIDFKKSDFDKLLKNQRTGLTKKRLQNAYLGFIVIKPLPKTIIGRTCLQTYPLENRREFPIVRECDVHLFGLELSVRSLPFQEQDQVAAACATSALWSVFQGTGKLFQHQIPSPVEITNLANTYYDHESRSLPSEGLTPAQMAHAVRCLSLEPYMVRTNQYYTIKSTIYAFLQSKIPLIMVIDLFDADYNNSRFKYLATHAVAVAGYSLGHRSLTPIGKTNFRLRASKIDKIYAHDDQVGPFARMEFDGKLVTVKPDKPKIVRESLSISLESNKSGHVIRAVPTILLVPIYHKIRITFGRINDSVIRFDSLIERLRVSGQMPLVQRLEWDIYLTTVCDFKNEIISSKTISGNYKQKVLLEGMPRFIWRATAYGLGGKRIVDLLFDATDVEQGTFFIRAIEYDTKFAQVLKAFSRIKWVQDLFKLKDEWRVISWFSKN